MTFPTVLLDLDKDHVFRHRPDRGRDLCPWCRRWFGPKHDAPWDYSAELGRPCPICPEPGDGDWTLPQRVTCYLRQAVVPGPHANEHDRRHFDRTVQWARTGDYQ